MGLDVEPPDPPSLPVVDPNEYEDAAIAADEGVDYRRDDLETFLEEGAWRDGFERWAADTDLDEREFRIASELGLFGQFDFFWDDFADRVGHHAPGIPEDWKERPPHEELDSWATVSGINAAMTELGETVATVLKDHYIDWEAAYEPPEDLPDFD